jgi:hypothetical protein
MWTNPYSKIFKFCWECLEIIRRNKLKLEVFFKIISHTLALLKDSSSGE